MIHNGVFVDDEEDVWADQLSTPGKLEFDFIAVAEVTELARAIRAKTPVVVALDYRLDEAATSLKPEQTYKGSALAQHLRDGAIETPAKDSALVLVSAEAKVRNLFRPDKTAHDLFDRVYVKEEINDRRAEIRRELLSLGKVYAALRAKSAPYNLAALMNATEEDLPAIEGQELRLKMEQAKAPHVVVRVVLDLLIDRPGPLVDAADVCAHLGISYDQADEVSRALHDTRYTGLFSDAWPRWWMHRVESWSQALFERRATGLPASERARIISDRLGLDLRPAVSPWTGSPNELIALACACCRHGVEMRHTVAVFEPTLPRFATRRRLCWNCVQTDAYEGMTPPITIDEIDVELAKEVKVMKRPTGAGNVA